MKSHSEVLSITVYGSSTQGGVAYKTYFHDWFGDEKQFHHWDGIIKIFKSLLMSSWYILANLL